MKNLLVTGYRMNELNIFDQKNKAIVYIKRAIAARLAPLAEEGLEWVLTPGQLGVDLWACETVIALKRERFPDLKLGIVTAYANPDEKWKEDKQNYYRAILKDLDYYGAVSNRPYEGAWQFKARDELLFRKTDGILLFYDEEMGEASPKFVKERALKLADEEGYRYMAIGADEVQGLAEEDRPESFD
ncbi:SLOG family protein [Cohnella sp. REN36]|uniref:SLOG family protein n=1 Tax=Cohnella sp. REN36 TaxID=2887347 RepID=UPI001D14D1A5|nr:SLOG family protein [Cohnella sp. REN36]